MKRSDGAPNAVAVSRRGVSSPRPQRRRYGLGLERFHALLTEIWVVGGTTRHWDGMNWNVSSGAGVVYSLWVGDANTVLGAGDFGRIQKWSGTDWPVQKTDTYVRFHGIWGSSTNNIYVVGDGGAILHKKLSL